MLLELAVCDAYGAGFEFNQSAYEANQNDLSDYVRHFGHPGLLPGMYTDDTQMSIALAELLLSEYRYWTNEHIAKAFLNTFKRDPRRGYASRFQGFLEQTKTPQEFLANIVPNSDRSGSSMRSGVMGLISNMSEMSNLTQQQAKITHDTPNGVASAWAVAFSTHYFYYRLGKKKDLINYLDNHVIWTQPSWTDWKGKVGVVGVECVRAALTAFMRNEKMSDMLIDCINFTGDVDTVATIAGAIGCVCDEMKQDLPSHLIDKLENNEFGKDYLIALDEKLAAKFPRPQLSV
jgi:ADP-ribosylglycohydrolase